MVIGKNINSEKIEIVMIIVTGICTFFLMNMFPSEMRIGRLMLYASALLLLQSLIRDLYILSRKRSTDKLKSQKQAQCMCVESTVGIIGILIGTILFSLGLGQYIKMTGWAWPMLVMIVLFIGFSIKDFVFGWNPWQIYRDKDHMNIIFTWKS